MQFYLTHLKQPELTFSWSSWTCSQAKLVFSWFS